MSSRIIFKTIYYFTILYFDKNDEEKKRATEALQGEAEHDSAADVLNEPCDLADGVARIAKLMHDRHPEDDEINFFGRFTADRGLRIEADDDGWFKAPVFGAIVSPDPDDGDALLEKRDAASVCEHSPSLQDERPPCGHTAQSADQRYTVFEKRSFLRQAQDYPSIRAAAKALNVRPQQLYYWRQREEIGKLYGVPAPRRMPLRGHDDQALRKASAASAASGPSNYASSPGVRPLHSGQPGCAKKRRSLRAPLVR